MSVYTVSIIPLASVTFAS